ncbi:WRB/Get1 family [Syncephalastrum racemosum]|uniref:WRB/Get1 family n=1 Tax=Syncephalastrum racemosum TaxID=13706 RepID=A0A1X2H2A7_SYNRA|nr:WRB/Get1 family [Syncephalastrum racemosum]
MYLVTTLLLLVLLTETILLVGYSYITRKAYNYYVLFVNDDKLARQKKLKRDLLTLKNELSQTSSQDEFAKWAKMRRKLDKGMAELEKLNSDIAFARTAFELRAKSVLWFLVNGSRIATTMWCARSAAFYLPQGWFGPAAWFLSTPMAPRGSVSAILWMSACRQVVKQCVVISKDFILPKKKTSEPMTQ